MLTSKELGDAIHGDLVTRETLLQQREKAALAKFTGWKKELEAREAALSKRETFSSRPPNAYALGRLEFGAGRIIFAIELAENRHNFSHFTGAQSIAADHANYA